MSTTAFLLIFCILQISLKDGIVFSSSPDKRIKLYVGDQSSIETNSDSQVSLSKKSIIDLSKQSENIYYVTALKKGFVIFNPTPITNSSPRFLITIVEKEKKSLRNLKKMASDKEPFDIKKTLKKYGIEVSKKHPVADGTALNCMQISSLPLQSALHEIRSSQHKNATTPKVYCANQKVTLKTSLVETKSATQKSLGTENSDTLIIAPKYSKMKSNISKFFSSNFNLTRNSSLIENRALKTKNANAMGIEISLRDFSFHPIANSTGSKSRLLSNFTIFAKTPNFKKSLDLSEILTIGETKTIEIASYRSTSEDSTERVSFSEIPIIGLIFKKLQNIDKTTTWLLQVEIIKMEGFD